MTDLVQDRETASSSFQGATVDVLLPSSMHSLFQAFTMPIWDPFLSSPFIFRSSLALAVEARKKINHTNVRITFLYQDPNLRNEECCNMNSKIKRPCHSETSGLDRKPLGSLRKKMNAPVLNHRAQKMGEGTQVEREWN